MDGESKYRNICGNYAHILCFKRFLNFFEKSACNLKKAVVLLLSRRERRQNKIVGVDCREGPPVPIPNTEVKLAGAEDTWLETARKNRFSPTQKTTCASRWFFCACGGQVAERSLPLASPGVKRWLSVRGGCGGCGGCARGNSRSARCHSLHPEKNTGCLSARAG